MLAVHFGAGNIGRGFIGSLLYQSGFETCFVDVNNELVDLINEKGEYRVVLADQSHEELLVKNVRAINSAADADKVIDAIAKADLVTAAVGPNILPLISGLIAEGLKKRTSPVNVIACENMVGGSTLLKEKVYEKVTEEEQKAFDERVGFPDAAVDRIVPNQSNEDKLMVTVEPFYEWAVDETKIAGEKPPVEGITWVSDLTPYIERKLFTVNTGHAVAAYFGKQSGAETINEALESDKIQHLLSETLKETGQFLVKKYGFDSAAHDAYIKKIIGRFANPFISDEVTRVGRSPIRKLGAKDRLVSPAVQYAELLGKTPVYLAKSIAAALLYDYPQDPESVEVQETIHQKGLSAAITIFTQLQEDQPLFKEIVKQYEDIEKNGI
ncbi:mannitol-1-phosphate 5-dehydrogenase [Domibacillus epiphyticus]|uniref:Mannitol-1-phosphate 5-dehydrogenase n=1 Tax=Domibacillus epiphyticus TaxID=1714355 RepID=A0A1V2A6L9_9BACI|nr:mannitol-1-phosphate 5-dehydrogenase [Domibacillus epiphyticus]OMP66474.1 mannitol-1-phosphate 5-dehydrogenase [Domibacillus epiphyticus]